MRKAGPKVEYLKCEVTFQLEEAMAAPVYVYFELGKFYQNHRTYVKSRSNGQLAGGVGEASSCDPLESVGSYELNPCGLAANNMFNDIIVVAGGPGWSDSTSPRDYMTESDISWASDHDGVFMQPDGFVSAECAPTDGCEACLGSSSYTDCGNYVDNQTGVEYKYWYPEEAATQYLYETYPEVISPIQGVENEHFMVWMRTAARSTFRNLYGRIEHDLAASARLTFNVTANFHVSVFGGTKSLVITTASTVGNKNGTLATAFLSVGGACLVAGLVVLSKFQASPRELADIHVLDMASASKQ